MEVGMEAATEANGSANETMTASDRQDAGLPEVEHKDHKSIAGYDPADGDAPQAPETTETESEETPAETKSTKKTPKKSLAQKVAESASTKAKTPAAAETPTSGEKPLADGEYKPNVKFKYAVEGKAESQEGEIDPKFHKFITDKESEDLMRDLYSKAHGLDFIKPKFIQTRQERDQLKQVVESQFQPLFAEVQQLGRAKQAGDIGAMLQMLDMPFEKVMQFVADELKFQELPPEQQRAVAAQRQAQTRAWQTETHQNGLAQQLQSTSVRLRQMELDHALDRAEVKSVQEAVDERRGKGAFRSEVIRLGKAYASEQNIDRPVDELVQEVAQMFKPFLPEGGTPNATPAKNVGQAGSGQGQPAATTKREKPGVLPNVESKATVPTRKEFSRIKDLKKHRRDMESTQLAGDDE